MDRFQKLQGLVQGDGSSWSWASMSRFGRLQKKVNASIDDHVRRDVQICELLFVPVELQTSDPSLIREINSGQFGLDGIFIEVGEGRPSIFDAVDVDDSFNRALHGFGWLRDLDAAKEFTARLEAQKRVFEWIKNYQTIQGIPYEPEVIASRVVSFLTHSPFILQDVQRKQALQFMKALSQQVDILHKKLQETSDGLPRLQVLSALVLAGICLSKHEPLLVSTKPQLLAELDAQILLDGGHVSRNPIALLKILFEILPLKEGLVGRQQQVPADFNKIIVRMMSMVRFLRLGDASLARFNGASATPTNALATLLASEERKGGCGPLAAPSGYARLEQGSTIVLVDAGAPPPPDIFAMAHAGCLSFEMSIRHFAFVVNSGAYMGEDGNWQAFARSTPAHSTLSINHLSSGGFLASGQLAGPVEVGIESSDALSVRAFHKGYQKQFGLRHLRSLTLSHKGLRLTGVDELQGTKRPGDHAFQIRFHLHPFIEIAQSNEHNLLLTLPDGEIWRFSTSDARILMEDSHYLAYRIGPQSAHQIVLAGEVSAETRISWIFEQYRPRPDSS